MTSTLLACVALPCALLAACVDQEQPATELRFDSTYCGRRVCDLSAPLATGSTMVLNTTEKTFGDALVGASIESSDPTIARIGVIDTTSFILRAEIVGVADGDVELAVVSAAGEVLETMPLRVRTADRLGAGLSLATAGSIHDRTPAQGIDHEADVSANTRVEIDTIPSASGEVLLGVFTDYSVEVHSNAPADEQPQPRAEDAKFGRFDVRVSAYDHDVTIHRANLTTTIRLHGR
ncbi:MAG: hypothetical protein HOV81_26575 [Kofleriaceae bacterium]|nr:hypothetical protein [Kofleriaceae bacterium]